MRTAEEIQEQAKKTRYELAKKEPSRSREFLQAYYLALRWVQGKAWSIYPEPPFCKCGHSKNVHLEFIEHFKINPDGMPILTRREGVAKGLGKCSRCLCRQFRKKEHKG